MTNLTKKGLVVFLIGWGVTTAVLGYATFCKANDFIEIQNLGVQAIKMFPGGVDPLITQNGIPGRTVGERLSLDMDTNIVRTFYWDSKIHAATDSILNPDGSADSGQFRLVGLEMHLGIQWTDDFQAGYYHHSQHLLDTTYQIGPFPREDGIEIRFNIFRAKEPRRGIF